MQSLHALPDPHLPRRQGQTVPLAYSARLEAILKENGGKVDLVVIPGIGHENAIMKYTAESFLEFLKK